MAQPRWESISIIFSMELDSRRGDWTRFSTARTTPWGVRMPTVVEPSCSRTQGDHMLDLVMQCEESVQSAL